MDNRKREPRKGLPKSFYFILSISALLLSFNAGWALRNNQSGNWVPPSSKPSPVLALMQTVGGHALADPSRTAAADELNPGDAKLVGTKTDNAKTRTYKPDLKPYETLDEVRRAIKENFVHTKVDDTELTYGAVRGMLKSLGDRFTRFLTPDQYREFQTKNDGEFVGVGARIDTKEEYSGGPESKPYKSTRPYIVEVMKGGPSIEAGLKKDDVILAIDGKTTADVSEDAVVAYIRGPRGSVVTLKIERKIPTADKKADPVYKVLDIKIKRDVIEVHPVNLTWLDGRIAWLRLDEFNKKSDTEMTAAIQEIRKGPNGEGPAKGIVLDMRNNPGGLLDVAVDIGGRFVNGGPVVYTEERDGTEDALKADPKRYASLKMPIVVLINKYSASAAEILTGALKDNKLATVVGEHSYGKASVQVLIELKNGGALVLTTAKYLTPGKHDISEKGIVPDVQVDSSNEDESTGKGAQLQKAVAIVNQENATRTAAAGRVKEN